MEKSIENKKEKIILEELEKTKKESINSSGDKYYSILIDQVKNLARKFQLPNKEIEIFALRSNIIPERYHRNLGVISTSEQVKLLNSKVAIIGVGGLGGMVLELLVRVGVGEIIIVDKDFITDSNLNRQILTTEINLSAEKISVAIQRAKEINSDIKITGHPVFINLENIEKIINGVEVVVDALDNLTSRFVLQKACRKLKIPLVHGAVAGFSGQLTTIFPQDKGLELIYGTDKDLPDHGSEAKLGAHTVIPAIFGSLEAQEVIKILLKKGKLFRNKLLYLDIEEGIIETINL